ncbi:MAG: hypothetical protein JWO41_104 [Candidatus Saccharibacteria bacterium]|nr:hypothetical protein [Candidatus Saccharibacteria bacterium]
MPPQNQPNYDFILNPEKPQRSRVPQPKLMRIAVLGGGLVLFLIIASIVINLVRGSNATLPSLTSLIKQQQLLIHITDDAVKQTGVSVANSGAAATIDLTMGSQQQELIDYATLNHLKINAKQSTPDTTKVDSALQAAASGGTYNATLHSTLVTEVTNYRAYLQRAYSNVKGAHGRSIIQKDYDAADLLLKQLNTN